MTELTIVTGILAALIIFYWCCKRDDKPENVCEQQTPGDIFRAIGAVTKKDYGDEDGGRHTYMVEYQGDYFLYIFHEDSPWVVLRYFGFKECAYEHLHKAYAVANNINITQGAWSCGISKMESDTDGTPFLTASLEYLFSCIGNLGQMAEELQALMANAFRLARDFSAELDKAIKEDKEKDEVFFNDFAFNSKLSTMMRQMETQHSEVPEDEEKDDTPFFLSVHQLVQLYDNADFGCLLSLKIVQGDQVKHITDIKSITVFDVRDYIRQHATPTALDSIILVYGFEQQELLVNLTKAKGSTDNTLYYTVNVVRSGRELDEFMGYRTSLCRRTMLEVRLTEEDNERWEVKYMIDDAMDKVSNGKQDELTDEQQLMVAYADPTVQADLYWGKKYFNNNCYYQALYHFNHVYHSFQYKPIDEWSDELKSLFCDISYYIGFIYADLGMSDRAYYYLDEARKSNRISSLIACVTCVTFGH